MQSPCTTAWDWELGVLFLSIHRPGTAAWYNQYDRYKPGFQLQPEKLFEHNFVHIPDKLCVWFLNCKLGLIVITL